MYLFVYGTLKKDFSNHHLIRNTRFIGEDKTRDNYCMIDMGYFPAILERDGTTPISGETYLADEKLLEVVDEFEGKWFYRKQIRLESGKRAYAYFLSPEAIKKEYPLISDGNWKR
ncbi:gamma-glutamylcyclotransferase (GGCT)/AIG2-like uncharacterized protein YtfP [Methanohalophilus levihalophilus]|uniref:gamma-glutamylcyclotransferase family protein n=1 Tax=Methanohalophilus levihalophilus TaxID=1431282 RepID=UPI001AE3204A|nr:gamma-glutamylcyclotransferase family protein [Methanohalophilus levihalophilus]MBP2029693.1 gamma-glutamylcyclotransferase (GGCT)/AIG2-like uncharacterized protein YtfP [Methanohalophilus levihalophilus]